MVISEIAGIVEALPKPLHAHIQQLPVTYEHQPGVELQADGIEPDTLETFVGAGYGSKRKHLFHCRSFCFGKYLELG